MTVRRYTVAIDERPYTIDIRETAADRFEVTVDGRTYGARLVGDEDLPGTAISPGIALPGARPFRGPAGGASATRFGQAPARESSSASMAVRAGTAAGAILASPMPGVVLEVLVGAGATVARGDPLLVLEAMKMRNTIRAPRDALVVEVPVEPGQPVGPGQPLVRFGGEPGWSR
jgi:glutaconyl-CoA decarboxylase